MSKIFKRPMFRKGGSTNEMTGIMSGIVDRENHATDPFVGDDLSLRQRINNIYKEIPDKSIDPLARLLIEGGLSTVSAIPIGGLLPTIARSFKEPTVNLFKDLSEKDDQEKKIAVEIELMDFKIKSDEKLAELQRKFLASEGDKNRQNELKQEYIKLANDTEKITPIITKAKQIAELTNRDEMEVFNELYQAEIKEKPQGKEETEYKEKDAAIKNLIDQSTSASGKPTLTTYAAESIVNTINKIKNGEVEGVELNDVDINKVYITLDEVIKDGDDFIINEDDLESYEEGKIVVDSRNKLYRKQGNRLMYLKDIVVPLNIEDLSNTTN